MLLRVGYELIYQCTQPTAMLFLLNVHSSRAADIIVPDHMVTNPPLPTTTHYDGFGNLCTRAMLPAGETRLSADALVYDSGEPDYVPSDLQQHAVQDLPAETLPYLLGSRYCETDSLGTVAWELFGGTPQGAARVLAICDFVHERIRFDYQRARPTRTAWGAYEEQTGVCRDYTHLAVAFCRAMNIPARYCTGYISDIGTSPPYIGDFAAWFEAYLDGRWHTFDPRHNVPRIGRVLMARGRDAADVPLSHSFGPNQLTGFTVWTDEVEPPVALSPQSQQDAPSDAARRLDV